jgi:hypothetical protein
MEVFIITVISLTLLHSREHSIRNKNQARLFHKTSIQGDAHKKMIADATETATNYAYCCFLPASM